MAGVSQPNEHISVFDFRLENGLADSWIQAVRSGCDIELPSVPRAGDDAASQLSFPQWATLMSADAINRSKLTIDIEESNQPPTDRNFFPGTLRDFRDISDLVPFSHLENPLFNGQLIRQQNRRSHGRPQLRF